MANCPKCGYHLKITDWKPNCPNCKVNMVNYGAEERLKADAEKAETERADFRNKLSKSTSIVLGPMHFIANGIKRKIFVIFHKH